MDVDAAWAVYVSGLEGLGADGCFCCSASSCLTAVLFLPDSRFTGYRWNTSKLVRIPRWRIDEQNCLVSP